MESKKGKRNDEIETEGGLSWIVLKYASDPSRDFTARIWSSSFFFGPCSVELGPKCFNWWLATVFGCSLLISDANDALYGIKVFMFICTWILLNFLVVLDREPSFFCKNIFAHKLYGMVWCKLTHFLWWMILLVTLNQKMTERASSWPIVASHKIFINI